MENPLEQSAILLPLNSLQFITPTISGCIKSRDRPVPVILLAFPKTKSEMALGTRLCVYYFQWPRWRTLVIVNVVNSLLDNSLVINSFSSWIWLGFYSFYRWNRSWMITLNTLFTACLENPSIEQDNDWNNLIIQFITYFVLLMVNKIMVFIPNFPEWCTIYNMLLHNNFKHISFLYDCMVNTIYLLSLWKHHVNLLLQSFRSVSSDLHQC